MAAKFENAMSVEAFKRSLGETTLSVIKSPKTGKLFFSCGDVTGAIAENFDKSKKAEVCLFTPDGSETAFPLLYNPAENNVLYTL